jgi:hypothetical protein
LAQCARRYEGIVHRSQQSGPFLLGVTILEIMNIPVPRFGHFSTLGTVLAQVVGNEFFQRQKRPNGYRLTLSPLLSVPFRLTRLSKYPDLQS